MNIYPFLLEPQVNMFCQCSERISATQKLHCELQKPDFFCFSNINSEFKTLFALANVSCTHSPRCTVFCWQEQPFVPGIAVKTKCSVICSSPNVGLDVCTYCLQGYIDHLCSQLSLEYREGQSGAKTSLLQVLSIDSIQIKG